MVIRFYGLYGQKKQDGALKAKSKGVYEPFN